MTVGETLQKWTKHPALSGSAPWRDAAIMSGLVLLVLLARLAFRNTVTTLLTLRAMALSPTLSRRLSDWVKSLSYSEQDVWGADGAEEPWVKLRKDAIDRLSAHFQTHCAKSIAWGNEIRGSFSDLRFTDANRVPFPFTRTMREKF